MNCEQSRQFYLESLNEAADIKHQASFDEHTSACSACQAFISAEEALIDRLRNYPPEIAPKRLLKNAMHEIATEQKLKRYRATNIGFGIALTASLAIAILMPGVFNPSDRMADDPLPTIIMSMNSQRTIDIVFDSPESVDDAVITLSLPDNIRIAGYEHKTQLHWNTRLSAGKNTLKLPLVASSSGRGLLLSRLEINGKSKQITLTVDVTPKKVSADITNSVSV